MIRMAAAAPGTGFFTSRRTKKASHAVNDVSGSAAASAQPIFEGFFPTIRSSTRWNSAFAPDRVMEPAYQTSSPHLETCYIGADRRDDSRNVPAEHFPFSAIGRRRAATDLVVDGLTEMAFTSTRMSRPFGSGLGNSMSTKESAAEMGDGVLYPMAFMRASF
jgi:hypothetical protein